MTLRFLCSAIHLQNSRRVLLANHLAFSGRPRRGARSAAGDVGLRRRAQSLSARRRIIATPPSAEGWEMAG